MTDSHLVSPPHAQADPPGPAVLPAAAGTESAHGPIVVLVGRPNVGKSTLFNRLTRSRQALVTAVAGTTRDRREGRVDDGEYRFRLVDTGGMGFGMGLAFSAEVEAQIGQAVAGADYVWVLLDAKEGLNPFDAQLYGWVRRHGKACALVVNKADHPGRRDNLAEFYALGNDRLYAISAAHGLGVGELLAATARELPALRRPPDPPQAAPDEARAREDGAREGSAHEDGAPRPGRARTSAAREAGPLRVAFLGRPNVGKSSLVNRILGRARMIVSDVPGTTREAVETPFEAFGRSYVLVDTAGIRRRARTHEHLEKIGVLHSLGALNWVHVAVLVVDASGEVATQDARIARHITEARRAVVVALNKWDAVQGGAERAKALEADIRERLRFLEYAPFVRTSALDGSGVQALFQAIERAAAQFRREIQTADLNRMVQAATLRFPPPAQGRSQTRIHYGTQVGSEPPAFRFFANHPEQLDAAYTRFFENQLRHHFGLEGTPVRIEWRGRSNDRPPPRGAARPGVRGGEAAGPRKRRSAGTAPAPGTRAGRPVRGRGKAKR